MRILMDQFPGLSFRELQWSATISLNSLWRLRNLDRPRDWSIRTDLSFRRKILLRRCDSGYSDNSRSANYDCLVRRWTKQVCPADCFSQKELPIDQCHPACGFQERTNRTTRSTSDKYQSNSPASD